MAYANKADRPVAREMELEKTRPGALAARAERQRARRAIDKKLGKAARKGKDVSHKKALSKGGSNADGVSLQPASKNRSFKRNKDGSMK